MTTAPEERREDTCALQKSRECGTKPKSALFAFRTNCFGSAMGPRIAFTLPTSRLEFGYWNLEFLDRNESFA